MVASVSDYRAARLAILELIREKQCAPILVRLAWHDAGTYDKASGTGGPHAVMRHRPVAAHGANNGLNFARDLLEPIHKQFPAISYADLWSLAGVVAIEATGGPKMSWRAGRTDLDESACTPDGRLPDASKRADHLRDIFYRMGMNDQEIVALSGAHALGRCHVDRSGFEGPWTPSPYSFDNQYFQLILSEPWKEMTVAASGNKQFWDDAKQIMMLPSDLCLRDDAAFRPWVEMYAKDQARFFSDFEAAFTKLLELGYTDADLTPIHLYQE